jgi:predicted nucleic acid-binding protein
MLDIVIDTNIIFSAILNKKSNISQIILYSRELFNFTTPNFSKSELYNHKNKIISITGYSEDKLNKLIEMFFEKITLIDENIIPDKQYEIAYNLCADIDQNDLFFVAVANHLNAKLWTGDKKLVGGLKKKGFTQLIDTKEMFELYIARN